MTTEIKFRAWDCWHECWYDFEDDLEFGEHGFINEGRWDDMDDDRFILSQFTGLFDKRGKEIFVGDILKNSAGHWEVKIEQSKYAVRVDYGYPGKHNLPCADWCEVVGNVYENPELLEKKLFKKALTDKVKSKK